MHLLKIQALCARKDIGGFSAWIILELMVLKSKAAQSIAFFYNLCHHICPSTFISGLEGNTVAFESTFDLIMQFRLGFGVSAFYAIPVDFGGADLGGLGYKFRFTFNF